MDEFRERFGAVGGLFVERERCGIPLFGAVGNDRRTAHKAYATLRVDDQGNAQTEPALVTATVEVQVVEAIEAKFVNPADNNDLGELRVMSAPTAGAAIHIANISAQKGVGNFRYTKENGSSADLLLDTTSGQVSLAGNYAPDGQNTLTIIVRVEDRGDGSTLTDAVLITLKFVLAETVKANAFLLNNDGKYLPGGAGGDLALTETRTIRVKTADYNKEQVAVGITPDGGFGVPYAVTEEGANGLSASDTAVGSYPIRVVVDANLSANNAPATLALTAVINDGNDTGNLTEGATITVSVVYDDVDPIAGAFNDMDGNAIAAKHVVVNSSTNAAGPNEIVASIAASGGVGGESGGNYTFSQMGNETGLIVNNEGKILVRQGIQPKASENELTATVRINDSGNWSHVSDAQEITVTVVYSSKVDVALSAFADIRTDADPAQIDPNGGTLYFEQAGAHDNIEFGQLTFQSGLPGVTGFIVTPGTANGLAYNTANNRVSIVAKCGADNQADKSIRLVVNDAPDPNNVSEPLTLDIMVHSGAAECIEPINARAQNIGVGGQPAGSAITEALKLYALAGTPLAEKMAVATVFIEKGAPAYSSSSTSGSGGLDLEGNGANLLTAFLPKDTQPAAGPNGNQLAITITINDDNDKGRLFDRCGGS